VKRTQSISVNGTRFQNINLVDTKLPRSFAARHCWSGEGCIAHRADTICTTEFGATAEPYRDDASSST
jgi:hypothetical protein